MSRLRQESQQDGTAPAQARAGVTRACPKNALVCGDCCTRISDLNVSLGGTRILEQVNLHVHCGELTVLIGPNGAGKTTLFRALLGEIPYGGSLKFAPAKASGRLKRPRIGYVPQKLGLDVAAPISVQDLFMAARARWPVWWGSSRALRHEAHAALTQVGCADLLQRPLGRLSGGQLQRVLLALALTPPPDLLLLDEPVAGMDQSGLGAFYRIVSQLRKRMDLSIFLVSHDLAAVAQVADRMVFLNHTVLADGSPQAVLQQPEVRQCFGLDVLHAVTENN